MLKSPLLKNTFLSLASKTVAMFLFFTTDIITARLLSVSEYGEWSFFYSTISVFFWVVWFGINPSTKVFVASNRAQPTKQNIYIRAGLNLRIIVSAILCVLFLFVAHPLAVWLGYPEKYPTLGSLLLLAPLLLFFNSLSEFFKEFYIGVVNFRLTFVNTILEFGGYLVFGVGLLWITRSELWLEAGYISAVFTCAVFGTIMLTRYLSLNGGLSCDNKIVRSHMFEIFRYSLPLLIINIGAAVMIEIDTFAIGYFFSGKEVATYAIIKKLFNKATHINLAISTATMTPLAGLTLIVQPLNTYAAFLTCPMDDAFFTTPTTL